jgi:hypothetical protein
LVVEVFGVQIRNGGRWTCVGKRELGLSDWLVRSLGRSGIFADGTDMVVELGVLERGK